MKRKNKKENRTLTLCALPDIISSFLIKAGGEHRAVLNALWENWDVVMGSEITSLGVPTGHKEKALLIAAEDNMAMQELSMLSTEIVERANAFMDVPYFTELKVHLLHENVPLNRKREPFVPKTKVVPPPPPNFGALSESFQDKSSPIAQCYEAYVRLYFPDR